MLQSVQLVHGQTPTVSLRGTGDALARRGTASDFKRGLGAHKISLSIELWHSCLCGIHADLVP